MPQITPVGALYKSALILAFLTAKTGLFDALMAQNPDPNWIDFVENHQADFAKHKIPEALAPQTPRPKPASKGKGKGKERAEEATDDMDAGQRGGQVGGKASYTHEEVAEMLNAIQLAYRRSGARHQQHTGAAQTDDPNATGWLQYLNGRAKPLGYGAPEPPKAEPKKILRAVPKKPKQPRPQPQQPNEGQQANEAGPSGDSGPPPNPAKAARDAALLKIPEPKKMKELADAYEDFVKYHEDAYPNAEIRNIERRMLAAFVLSGSGGAKEPHIEVTSGHMAALRLNGASLDVFSLEKILLQGKVFSGSDFELAEETKPARPSNELQLGAFFAAYYHNTIGATNDVLLKRLMEMAGLLTDTAKGGWNPTFMNTLLFTTVAANVLEMQGKAAPHEYARRFGIMTPFVVSVAAIRRPDTGKFNIPLYEELWQSVLAQHKANRPNDPPITANVCSALMFSTNSGNFNNRGVGVPDFPRYTKWQAGSPIIVTAFGASRHSRFVVGKPGTKNLQGAQYLSMGGTYEIRRLGDAGYMAVDVQLDGKDFESTTEAREQFVKDDWDVLTHRKDRGDGPRFSTPSIDPGIFSSSKELSRAYIRDGKMAESAYFSEMLEHLARLRIELHFWTTTASA